MSKSSKSDKKKKKHHATTPETLPSPTHDSESTKIDILNDDEIQGFAIRQEELDKLRKELETKQKAEFDSMEAKRQSFAVRKPVPVKKRVKHERLLVARAAPDAAKQRELDYSGPAGPKYTTEGHVVGYSLLGSVEDFVEEAVKNEDMLPETGPAMLKTFRKLDVGSYDPPEECGEDSLQARYEFDQTRALHRWDMHMRERRRQQDHLARLTDKPVERLAMNQDLDERNKFETRRMIEHVGPLYAPTRHHRDGLEFWKQEETIGNPDKLGLHLTLPRSERGFPFYYEHIKKPRSQLVETGQRGDYNADGDDGDGSKYKRGVYLRKRWIELAPAIHEIDPHQKLDCTDLEINVRKSKQDLLNAQADYNEFQKEIDECSPLTPDQLAPLNCDDQDENDDPLAAYPDHVPKIYDGPALLFNNHLARWNGSSDADQDEVGVEVRMNFVSSIDGRDIMKLKVENRGTTALHYEWHRIPTPPKFNNIKLDGVQRFYFNIGHGVILPGDVTEIPFTFKSPNAGIFYERWRFCTEPVVMGGAALLLVLKGVATQERHRAEVEKMCELISARLNRVEGKEVVEKLIDDLVRSVRTPERCASPLGAHMSEEEQFNQANPSLNYNYRAVQQLKRINAQLATGRYGDEPEEDDDDDDVTEDYDVIEWNMSVADLRCSAHGSLPDIDLRERCLAEINALVSRRLLLPLPIPLTDARYNATAWALQCFLDEMTSCSMHLRDVMGIPQARMSESLASVSQEGTVLQRALAASEDTSKAEKSQQSGKGKGKEKKDKKDKKEPAKPPTPKSRPTSRQQQQSASDNDDDDDYDVDDDDDIELEVDEETMDKYKARFFAFTRQLLVESLERIFDFFEADQ